jgi:hypothetical protein
LELLLQAKNSMTGAYCIRILEQGHAPQLRRATH